jgi:hypothetical protein
MEYRFPEWISYVLLASIALVIAAGIYVAGASIEHPHSSSDAAYDVAGACVVSLMVWGYLSIRSYKLRIGDQEVIISRAFRRQIIPFPQIKQVITVTTPRGGTDTWLIDGDDAVITKIDGSLVGFSMLIASLGQALKRYEVIFFKRDNFAPWEMQVAGDSHWVPYDAPHFARQRDRRMRYTTLFGCALIALAVALSWLGDHDFFAGH